MVEFICKHFILFDIAMNRIVFKFILGYSLLVYRNTIDFCILIFITSNSLFCGSLQKRVLRIRSYHMQTRNFISSFLIWTPSISFFGQVDLARTSSTMLHRSGEMGSLALLLILEEAPSDFH